jgi:hypothetical protein
MRMLHLHEKEADALYWVVFHALRNPGREKTMSPSDAFHLKSLMDRLDALRR